MSNIIFMVTINIKECIHYLSYFVFDVINTKYNITRLRRKDIEKTNINHFFELSTLDTFL